MSIYVTALALEPIAIGYKRVKDTYSIHRIVYDLFEDIRTEQEKQNGVSSGILFCDKGGDARGRKILILSNRLPLSDRLVQGMTINTKVISQRFFEHDHYDFRIVVNPTICSSKTKKRIPITNRNEIEKWFVDKAPALGFEIEPHQISVEGVSVDRFLAKGANEAALTKADIRGRLKVIDRDAFIKSISSGVGRGRGFGCGLLQVIPALENYF